MEEDILTPFALGVALTICIGAVIPSTAVLPIEYKAASTLCAPNGDVDKVRPAGFWTSTIVTCANGAKFKLDWDQLQKYKE